MACKLLILSNKSAKVSIAVKTIYRFLTFIGYVLYVGPSRAATLLRHEKSTGGELANSSLFSAFFVEAILRCGLLLMIGASTEVWLGLEIYNHLRLDSVFSILLISGSLHSAAQYFILVKLSGVKCANCLYRLVRNLCYSVLPGLFVVSIFLGIQFLEGLELYPEKFLLTVYAITTGVFLVAGLVEGLLASRRPTGLDDNLAR